MIDRDTLITEITDSLDFDKVLAEVAYRSLSAADDGYLLELHQETMEVRQEFDRLSLALSDTNRELLRRIEEWDRNNHLFRKRGLHNLVLWLGSETGPIARLAGLVRDELSRLRDTALEDLAVLGGFLRVADAVAQTALQQSRLRAGNEEKILLTELAVFAFVGINDVLRRHNARPFQALSFNCLQACAAVDSLGGFNRNVDQFSSLAADELRRIGPTALTQIELAMAEAADLRVRGEFRSAVDRLTNVADVLTLWVAHAGFDAVEYDSEDVFKSCRELYELALRILPEVPERTVLVTTRYARSCLVAARYRLESCGRTELDSISSYILRGTEVVAEVIEPRGKFYDATLDLIAPRLLQLELAELAFEVRPEAPELRESIVSEILSLAEDESERLRTVRPWLILYRVYAELDDVEAGVARLSEFAENTASPQIRERAERTVARLKQDGRRRSGDIASWKDREGDWWEQLRTRPSSISAFKAALAGYLHEGHGPNGDARVTHLAGGLPDVDYARSFRHLLAHDSAAMRGDSIKRGGETRQDDAGTLLAAFGPAFSQKEIFSLEELSRFLLERGQRRLYREDIRACVAVLELGLSYSDDAFWYGRLIAAYRLLGDLDNAAKVARRARHLFPRDSVIAVEAALVLVGLNDSSGAAQEISRFLEAGNLDLSSCHPAVQGVLAYATSLADPGGKAEQLYRGMVTSRPGDWRARHGLGCLLFRQGPGLYPEAIGHWTSAILSAGSTDDPSQARISKDCFYQIAQTVKEMRLATDESSTDVTDILRDISAKLPTPSLQTLCRALTVCGGLQEDVLVLAESVSARNNTRLLQSFTQCCTSMLVEDLVWNRHMSSYSSRIVEFARQNGTLGDLFGGAKGAYYRNLLRLSANPVREKLLKSRFKSTLGARLPAEWAAVADIVAVDGYLENYYDDIYQALTFASARSAREIDEMLLSVLSYSLSTFSEKVDENRIIMGESFVRSFSLDRETVSELHVGSGVLTCDPDKLRAVLRLFEPVQQSHSNGITSWDLAGTVSVQMRSALAGGRIRAEVGGMGVTTVSVSGGGFFL